MAVTVTIVTPAHTSRRRVADEKWLEMIAAIARRHGGPVDGTFAEQTDFALEQMCWWAEEQWRGHRIGQAVRDADTAEREATRDKQFERDSNGTRD